MQQLLVPLVLTMAILSPSCGPSAITSLYSSRRRLGIVYAAEKSYGETSAGVRSLVSSLTAMVNAIGGKGGGDGSIVAVRTRQFESLSKESVLEGLRKDFEDHQYLWSGKITPELCKCTVSTTASMPSYCAPNRSNSRAADDEGCVFTDPTLSFTGLSTFETNLENLDPFINLFCPPSNRKCVLRTIELVDEGKVVEATWRMVGDLKLPWNPRLDLNGRTRYTLGGAGGRIVSYDESWELKPYEALLQLVRPHWGEKEAL